MPASKQPNGSEPRRVLVAGDICLDVVRVPMPAKPPGLRDEENWRLTGETRTHFLPGGALLLSEFVRAATQQHGVNVIGPQPVRPTAVNDGPSGSLSTVGFLKIAARLCRDEVVHSLLSLAEFPGSPKPGALKSKRILRVDAVRGFSGPDAEEPSLDIQYADDKADLVILDDTGNRFRRKTQRNPWPAAALDGTPGGAQAPWILYKLHRPLPGSGSRNLLWDAVAQSCSDRRIVVLSADDLRAAGVQISQGYSWEQTALDVGWHLLNSPQFAPLRDCPWLIVRLGLSGAILWCTSSAKKPSHEAWLIYDPNSIEGKIAGSVPGQMVGFGSVFIAALAKRIVPDLKVDADALCSGIKAGLLASRRLLELGYGMDSVHPAYPGCELFEPAKLDDALFASQPIPIIPGALQPDRGGWRLLEQIFSGKTDLLHRAVVQVATRNKPPKEKDDQSEEAAREREAEALLKQVPLAEFGALRAYDRREIENYRFLHTLLRDYLCARTVARPLSIAVFGPPGAGKSFGIKQVAQSLKGLGGCRDVKTLTFNLSLYQTPEELAGAFHLVRDEVLTGKVPLVFFDEFDTALGGKPLAWLRHFLAPMQDGQFLDRGAPHPIGQAIFVFAGGTSGSYAEFKAHAGIDAREFQNCKGPDFLSRLRATLDIPSLNLLTAFCPPTYPRRAGGPLVQPPGTYNPFGPIEALPCEPAILLRRAAILSFNLKEKAPCLACADGSLNVHAAALRALLFLPEFEYGNRSFEALLDMSHLAGACSFWPSRLPPAFQLPLHAEPGLFGQLVGTELPFSAEDRWRIAKAIHEHFLKERKARKEYDPGKPTHQEWGNLALEHQSSNADQADDIPRKLIALGLWLRKASNGPIKAGAARLPVTKAELQRAARAEHDRWVASKRKQGFLHASQDDPVLRHHHCLLPWDDPRLKQREKDKDIEAIRTIPQFLAAAGYEVIKPLR